MVLFEQSLSKFEKLDMANSTNKDFKKIIDFDEELGYDQSIDDDSNFI